MSSISFCLASGVMIRASGDFQLSLVQNLQLESASLTASERQACVAKYGTGLVVLCQVSILVNRGVF